MKRLLFFGILLAYSTRLPNVEASEDFTSTSSYKQDAANGNLTVLEKWQFLEKKLKEITNAGVKMILPTFMDNSAKLKLSKECMRNSMNLISGVKNLKTSAMRFLDSSGKIIDGLMIGTLSSFGAYDECVDTEVKSTRPQNKEQILYRGQYCTIDLVPPLPSTGLNLNVHETVEELRNFSQRDTAISEAAKIAHFLHYFPIKYGICVPSGCTVEDIDKVARTLGDALMISAKVSRCEVKEKNNFTPIIIAVIACYSFAGFLVLVGSLIDIYTYYKKTSFTNNFIRVLVAFSFIRNFRKFINAETSSNSLSCLNGVRFITMSWIIVGHSYLLINFHLLLGVIKIQEEVKKFSFQVIVNSTYAVDTFFFMGGMLVCYLLIKRVRIEGHKFNFGLYIFHRIWRILPVYVSVILFMFLLDLIGSGPVWHDSVDKYIKPCYYNWWSNILFISNFYDSANMCIPHSWYLASDFQLYVAALIIVLPMISKPKVGILLSILAIVASIIYSGVGTYVNGYPFAMLTNDPDVEKMMRYLANFYFRPFIHTSPYCIGLLAGYLLATKPDLKIPPIIQVIGWSLAFVVNFAVVYGVADWNGGAQPSLLTGLMYASFNRTAWTLGVAWVIICCATGHGGVINYILSWKAFIPLGRLTYLAYLTHFLVEMVFWGNLRARIQPSHFVNVWLFFGHLCTTYGIAFAGSMLIEAPFLSLEKLILTKAKEPENNSVFKGNFELGRNMKSEMNGDLNGIIPKSDEECGGTENTCVVNRL